MPRLSALLIALCVLANVVLAEDPTPFLVTKTTSNLKKCYIEDLPEETTARFIYQFEIPDPIIASKPAAQQAYVQLQITDPTETVISDRRTALRGDEKLTIKTSGEHKICITPVVAVGIFGSEITMNLKVDFLYGTDADEIASVDQIKELEKVAERARSRTGVIRNELKTLKRREEEFHHTSETTNRRVLVWSIFQFLLLFGCCFFQMYNLKKFFRAKKLI